MVFNILREDLIQKLLRLSAGRLIFVYVYYFFSILTFNNHRVIDIKCIATTPFSFQVDGEIGWNHPLKLYFVVPSACLQSIDVCHKQRFKASLLLFVVWWRLLLCAAIEEKILLQACLAYKHAVHFWPNICYCTKCNEGACLLNSFVLYEEEWNIRSGFLLEFLQVLYYMQLVTIKLFYFFPLSGILFPEECVQWTKKTHTESIVVFPLFNNSKNSSPLCKYLGLFERNTGFWLIYFKNL